MKIIRVPEWAEALRKAQLPDSFRRSAEISIRWYLSFCRRARVEVTVQSACDFIEWAAQQKLPESWQLEDWKEGIRWFFRAAKDQESAGETPAQAGDPWLPARSAGWPE